MGRAGRPGSAADPDARDVDHRATPAQWMLHQALIERRDSVHDSTPLGWCFHGARFCCNAEGDYPAVARMLLEAGARVGPNFGDAPEEVMGGGMRGVAPDRRSGERSSRGNSTMRSYP